ncbi:MAG: long-chain fatty acid--CoA ligase [Deltaproteobacteria bacterium]|nr:long-chain fatty acid--CoA ligase [Deltaproteobacteria bacterium]MCL5276295.1 long-chain fatty acid--CoA ligase [Deltaproteobacteria bacterium]
MEYKTVPEMFWDRLSKNQDRILLKYKSSGRWQDLSWRDFGEQASWLAKGFLELGIKKDDKICILSENRLEWYLTDIALISIGATDVPIYPTNTPWQIEYLLNDAEARAVVVSTMTQYNKVLQVKSKLKALEGIIIMEPDQTFKEDKAVFEREGLQSKYKRAEDGLLSFSTLVNKGRTSGLDGELRERIKSVKQDDLITIIYTSGTTGEPKGVMLTHSNIMSDIEGLEDKVNQYMHEGETALCFLPLSHSFARTADYYAMLYFNVTMSIAESIDRLMANLQEIRPTVMVSVPRVYEKAYARILETVDRGSRMQKKVFRWAVDVADRFVGASSGGSGVPLMLRLKYAVGDRLVYSTMREKLGGRIKYFISGGAPLSPELGRFFHGMGINILEGYGLTETSPVIAVNDPGYVKYGTVGRPLKNCLIKIAQDGEILVKGPMIMKGYYNKPDMTAEVIDKDGWFHTGDIGFIDDKGYLHITDRKKDLIVTAGGKNIAPQPIENMLKLNKFIEQTAMIGDKRPYCVALIVPNFEALYEYARENQIPYKGKGDLIEKPEVQQLYKGVIDGVNGHLARYETIKKFKLLSKEFSEATGELTPTLKVKRRILMEKYGDAIEQMYRDVSKEVNL